MKLINLTHYRNNDFDEIIFNALTQSSDKDILDYVINVTSDLLNGVFLTEEFKLDAKNKLKNFDEKELGELATYICITPYVQAALSKKSNWQGKATSFLECYIGYIINTMDKEEFLGNLSEMINLLNLSNKFYNGLVIYFGENKHMIAENILSRLQF